MTTKVLVPDYFCDGCGEYVGDAHTPFHYRCGSRVVYGVRTEDVVDAVLARLRVVELGPGTVVGAPGARVLEAAKKEDKR